MTSRYSKEQLLVRKNIKKYRLMRKYTSRFADLTGLTHDYVRDLGPLLEKIGKFADALEIDFRQLFDDFN